MTNDLEQTLRELDPGCREVVGRLRAAREIEPRRARRGWTPVRRWRASGRLAAALTAAAVLGIVALSVTFGLSPHARTQGPAIYTVAYARDAQALARILASQRADGSWENDFLTRQNAAALRRGADPETRIAYKKAVRYLRARGLEPLSDAELRARADSVRG